MAVNTSTNKENLVQHKAVNLGVQKQAIAYFILGVLFASMLVLSALNDFLFFNWLCMATFIVLALVGFHFIGQKQIKRN